MKNYEFDVVLCVRRSGMPPNRPDRDQAIIFRYIEVDRKRLVNQNPRDPEARLALG
jgi:hypothetical protein